jgi:hypothetical protein
LTLNSANNMTQMNIATPMRSPTEESWLKAKAMTSFARRQPVPKDAVGDWLSKLATAKVAHHPANSPRGHGR